MITGKRLGRYELLEPLGEGGMGAVWLARLTGAAGFEKLCIVKTVLPSIAKDADFVSRFLHEGRVLTQLAHGNIAQVLDMSEADGQLFLALEYIAGVDLSRLHEQVRAAQEFMPLPLVVALITQAAEGLGAAHRKLSLDGSPLNVVHRDVSPHNIMVSYEGEVKVIDFGIAKSEARSRHTAQASVMGKLGYMAPEQARGEPVDHRADQYALGIVAWELLSNQSWVKRGTLTEMVVSMANPTRRMLAPSRPDVPQTLEAVVLKALSALPEGRFASTDEFAQVLMGELLKLGPPPTKPQLGEYVKARCSADFATQRQLLTRVSTQRSPPPSEDPLAETVVRPAPSTGALTSPSRLGVAAPLTIQQGDEAPAPAAGETSPARPAALARAVAPLIPIRAEPPLTTGELAAASRKRSPALLILCVLVGLVVVAAIAFAFRPQSEVAVTIDAGTPVVEVIVDAGSSEALDAGTMAVVLPDPLPVEGKPTLNVVGRLGGNSWIVSNQTGHNWTRCRMTLPGQRVLEIGTIPRGSLDFPVRRFVFKAAAPQLKGVARVDCSQGFGLIDLPRP